MKIKYIYLILFSVVYNSSHTHNESQSAYDKFTALKSDFFKKQSQLFQNIPDKQNKNPLDDIQFQEQSKKHQETEDDSFLKKHKTDINKALNLIITVSSVPYLLLRFITKDGQTHKGKINIFRMITGCFVILPTVVAKVIMIWLYGD